MSSLPTSTWSRTRLSASSSTCVSIGAIQADPLGAPSRSLGAVRLYVIARHAESTLNIERRVNGDPSVDVPLTEEGREEARQLGIQVANVPFDLCMHTRFGRTRDTLAIAVAGRALPMAVEPLLDDIYIGDLEGRSIDDYRAWKRIHTHSDAFPGGESLDDAALRYARGFQALLARPEERVLVVCHEIPLRYALNAAGRSVDLDGPVHELRHARAGRFKDRGARERVLGALEEPLPLVAGHGLVEEPLLGTRVVQVVVDDLVAEGLPGERRALERLDRLPDRGGNPRQARIGVGVPLEHRRRLDASVETVQAGRDHRREGEVRIGVCARDARLDPQAVPVPDDAEAARSVVPAPRERRRRPALGRVALVGVDVRSDEDRELPHGRDQAAEVAVEDGARPVAVVGREQAARALRIPEARVDVARAADPGVVGLGHERDRLTVLVRDLLGAVLVDDVPVRRRHRVGEAEVDLVLARPGLALRELDRDARVAHPAAEVADHVLVEGGREDVVVEDVGDRGRDPAEVLLVRLRVGVLEEVELELRGEHRQVAALERTFDLSLQDLARRLDDRSPVLPADVAEDERRPVEPRDATERVHVGNE